MKLSVTKKEAIYSNTTEPTSRVLLIPYWELNILPILLFMEQNFQDCESSAEFPKTLMPCRNFQKQSCQLCENTKKL